MNKPNAIKRPSNNVGALIKSARLRRGASQTELSKVIGFKNGQYISNVERGLCGIPAECVQAICDVLHIETERFINAMAADYIVITREKIAAGRKPVDGVVFRVPHRLAYLPK